MIDGIFSYLYGFTDFEILLTFILFTPSISYFIYLVVWRALGDSSDYHDSFLGIGLFTASFSICALLLSFTMVQAITTVQTVKKSVFDEVVVIEELDALLLSHREPEVSKIRGLMKAYVSSVIDEWGFMVKPEQRMIVSKDLLILSKLIHGKLPVTPDGQKVFYDKVVSLLNDLKKARYYRLQHAGKSLPSIYWWAISFLMVNSVVLYSIITRKTKLSAYVLVLPMTALGTILGLVVIYDNPFTGDSGVSIEPYKISLQKMEVRENLFKSIDD